MSTIDTVESVLSLAEKVKAADMFSNLDGDELEQMLTRYALLIKQHTRLLEAVNRPVSDDDVDNAILAVRHVDTEGMEGDSWDKILVRFSIEAHMASLREEVGK